jgi:hypothetical protein
VVLEEDSEVGLVVVLEEEEDLETISEFDMNFVIYLSIYNNNNEFSLFKLSKINGCLHLIDMLALTLPLMCLKNKNS